MAEQKEKKGKQELQESRPARALDPFEEMERLFGSFYPRGWLRPFRSEWPAWGEMKAFGGKIPSVDLIERDKEIIVKAELPGVDKKDLDISVSENTVTIRGRTSHEEKEEKGDYYRSEISRGEYSRTLTLPSAVDESKAKASFKDGILKLTLPKQKESKRKKIDID